MEGEDAERLESLLETPGLADALESDRFKQFLDHVPIAILVSELLPSEIITYANLEFERLTGHAAASLEGKSWNALPGIAAADHDDRLLGEAVQDDEEYIGTFRIERADDTTDVDAWSNTIENDEGTPIFRLVALACVDQHRSSEDGLRKSLSEKDTMLRELQHRVKNNLQMITALIRLEARNVADDETGERFDRLAGRINALATLYHSLSAEGFEGSVDLGVYISQVASSVMQAHASEGIRLDLKVDTWPVSMNVAMPTGLVVNELLTNSFKHAFVGREGGTITVHSLIDRAGCRVVIADDGVGLPEGVVWPAPGKLGAVIARSLRENARARLEVQSSPNGGVRVTIYFDRADAAPEAQGS
jgi:PAS domain S-box-containing protein